MHVVLDARKIGDYGIGSYIRNLVSGCLELAPADRFSMIGALDATNEAVPLELRTRLLETPNIDWTPNRSTNYGLGELLTVAWQARRLDGDVFHAPHYVVPVGLRCPMVVTIHDCIHLRFPQQLPSRMALRYARTMLRRAVRKADWILTGSLATRDDLVDRLGAAAAKVAVVPYGCDPYFFAAVPPPDLDIVRERLQLPDRFLLYAGNIKPHKNLERLIGAVAEFDDDASGATLVVAGGSPDQRLLAQAKKLQLGDRIRFMGFVSRAELRALYHLASLFVYPSLYEGFGLPPLEAMACGTPVLVSNTGALPEVVENAGHQVDPYDVAAISGGIRRILQDSGYRRELAQRGSERAADFSWDRTARGTLEIYRQAAR